MAEEGEQREGVEHLVEAELARERVRALERVADGADRVTMIKVIMTGETVKKSTMYIIAAQPSRMYSGT